MKTFDSDNKAALKKVNDVIAQNNKEVGDYLKGIKKKLDAASKAAADKVKA
jgi:Asp-tRNA(Asn)/Glu-tRNA(Gln) amidotransferase B subunit